MKLADLSRPIYTYGGKGVSKEGVDPSHHAIAYTHKPKLSKEEEASVAGTTMLESIHVEPKVPWRRLDPMSRINFSELHTVHYKPNVKPFGHIDDRMHALFDSLRFRVLLSLSCVPPQVLLRA